ncbi:MAG: radical SAM protein [Bacteroidales bacterium]|nr:radical SAM protein [Bacteroidales bacterium]
MKKSKYNFLLNTNTQTVIYNIYNDELALIDPMLVNLYKADNCSEIEKQHPEFYTFLVDKGFIVEDNMDESLRQRMDWRKEDENDFSITINPTLNCNMRCWYCYEDHDKNTVMSEDVVSSIKELINKKTMDEALDNLYICFFGGEPLLTFNKIIYPLSQWACNLCEERGKKISISFVTNAYLLSEAVINKLDTLKVDSPMEFQITLDSNQRYHDVVRHTQSGKGSYSSILQNLKETLKREMYVSLRLNYTKSNIHSFIDVLSDLKEISKTDLKYLTIDMHRVWQDSQDDRTEKQVQKLRDLFIKDGFRVRNAFAVEKYRCYADRQNSVVINYNGDLFRCTARDFTNKNREGMIDKSGNLLWNEKSQKRDSIKYGNEFCMDCDIYPLCHGTCSQNKLESNLVNGCYCHLQEKDKKEIVEKRIKTLLDTNIV